MATTSLGEVPVPLKRRMEAMSSEVGGLDVAVAEASAPCARVPLLQPIRAVDISSREAMMRPRSERVIGFAVQSLSSRVLRPAVPGRGALLLLGKLAQRNVGIFTNQHKQLLAAVPPKRR